MLCRGLATSWLYNCFLIGGHLGGCHFSLLHCNTSLSRQRYSMVFEVLYNVLQLSLKVPSPSYDPSPNSTLQTNWSDRLFWPQNFCAHPPSHRRPFSSSVFLGLACDSGHLPTHSSMKTSLFPGLPACKSFSKYLLYSIPLIQDL